MSATASCGFGAAAVAAPSFTKIRPSAATGRSEAAPLSLIPVVGLVNRSLDRLQVKSVRWQQQQQRLSRAGDGRQRWFAQQRESKAASISGESQFETEVLKSSVPVLVDFWASWCGPCRLMGQTLEWAAQVYDGKIKCVKIETDRNDSLVEKYSVYGLPTLILFKNGEVVPNTQREGALNKVKLQAYLEENLPSLVSTKSTK